MEPIYVENQLAIPAGALLEGNIVSVHPAPHSKRLDAKFHGDFTPLGEPVIDFTELNLRNGERYPVAVEVGGGPGTTLYFRSAGEIQKSIFRRMWEGVVGKKNSTINTVKAPRQDGSPEELFLVPDALPSPIGAGGNAVRSLILEGIEPPGAGSRGAGKCVRAKPLEKLVAVRGRLRTQLDSAKAKPGDPVEAVVTQPVFDEKTSC